MHIILETERLILRKLTLDDAAFMVKLLNTPTWLQFIGDRNVHSIEDAENYLKNGTLKSYQEHGFGFYAVIEKAKTSDRSNKTIGICGLIKRDSLPDIDIYPTSLAKDLAMKQHPLHLIMLKIYSKLTELLPS
jgi:[ribosomal protein S5]-alanine N-acetyltransferase